VLVWCTFMNALRVAFPCNQTYALLRLSKAKHMQPNICIVFWEAIGFSWSFDQSIGELYQATRPNNIPEDQFGTFIALCCWQLWKRRNGIVFRNEALNLQQVLAACKVEAQLWHLRMPVPSRAVTNLWCHVFNNVM
jgi:hypothetical protein